MSRILWENIKCNTGMVFWIIVIIGTPVLIGYSVARVDIEAHKQSQTIRVHVDEATGCEYVRLGSSDSLTIRYDEEGFPMCYKKEVKDSE